MVKFLENISSPHFTNPSICNTITSVIIEFTNAIAPRSHSSVSVAIVVAACAFFFIPTTLIVLGYYSSQPTGTLISPLPQGILSDESSQKIVSPTPAEIIPEITPATIEAPIIAAPNESTEAANTTVTPESTSNITDHTATISAAVTEQTILNKDVKSTSQIYLSSKEGDKSIYSVKSKSDGQFIIAADTASDIDRYVDYHIVNP